MSKSKRTEKIGSKKKTPIFRDISWLPMIAQVLDTIVEDAVGQVAVLDAERLIEVSQRVRAGFDATAEDAAGQIEILEDGRTKPHAVDGHLMNRTIQAMQESIRCSVWYAGQLTRWLSLDLNPDQRREVERLIEVNQSVGAGSESIIVLSERIIELCEQIKKGTIKRIIQKDDLEPGVEVWIKNHI
jgi:hypothetical protein